MATLKIEVKDLKFISHNEVNVEVFESNYLKGNGWECRIAENGRVDCIATEFYNGERHQIKLKIDKMYVKVLLKIGNGRPRVLKSYKLNTFVVDGVIVLPGGFIDTRNPHFRNAEFQKFLDDYGLTAVRNQDPNGIYPLTMEHSGDTAVFYEDIETDGTIRCISEKIETPKESGDGQFLIKRMLEVTDATWVIKNVWRFKECQHRILYTLYNPKEITGLPKQE